jgi:hypothetical protein
MNEREPAPGRPGADLGHDPARGDEAHETELLREVLRVQEQHREGGVEPELAEPGPDPDPAGPGG